MSARMRILIDRLPLVGGAGLSNPSAGRQRARDKVALAVRSRLASVRRIGDLTAFASSAHSPALASCTNVIGERPSAGAFGRVTVPDRSDRSDQRS